MTVLKALFSSKKFLSFLVTVVVLVLTRKIGLDEAAAQELGREIVAVAASLLVAQGAADLGKESKRASE